MRTKALWPVLCASTFVLAACAGEVVVVTDDGRPECPPPREGSGIVFGEIEDVEGRPVPEADIRITGFQGSGGPRETPGACTGVEALTEMATADAAGFYRKVVSSIGVLSTCIVVEAAAGGARGMTSGAVLELRTNRGECTPESSFDSVRVDVALEE